MTYTMGRATTTKIGPNDASGIVWAIGEFSSYFFFFGKLINVYSIYNCSLRCTRWEEQQRQKWAQTDMSGIVWAICEFFFSFFFLFFFGY